MIERLDAKGGQEVLQRDLLDVFDSGISVGTRQETAKRGA